MRKKTIFNMAALALLLAGCSENEDAPQRPDLTGKPIVVHPTVNNNAAPRAGHDTGNLDKFVFFLNNSDGSITDNNYSSVIMKRKDGAWTPANLPEGEQMLWQNRNPQVNIVGYTLPDYTDVTYGTPLSDKVPVSLPADQTTDEAVKAADILQVRLNNIEPNANGELNFEMKHFMTKIKVNYSYSSEIAQESELLSCTMKNTPLNSGGMGLDFTQDWNTNLSSSKEDAKMHLDQSNRTAEIIMLPQSYLFIPVKEYPVLVFRLRIDGLEREFSCEVPAPNDKFQSGHQYIMPVTIGRDRVTPGNITIKGWEQGNGNGEDLETE